MHVVGLFLLVGITLGMLGGGGSILTLPLLVYVAGLEAKEAVAMSLLIVGVTSVFGVMPHLRRGHVDYRAALVFGPLSMAGAYAGGRLASYFSDTMLLVLFSLMMVLTAAAMLRRRAPAVARPQPGKRRTGWLALEGALVGTFTGLVGAGGGFLLVPALVFMAKLEMRRAVGTSLFIIVLNSLSGLGGHLSHVSLHWSLAFTLAGAAALGAVIGASLAGRVPARALRRGFGVFVLGMGFLVLALQAPPQVRAWAMLHVGWALAGLAALALSGVGWLTVRYLQKSTRRVPPPPVESLSVAPPR